MYNLINAKDLNLENNYDIDEITEYDSGNDFESIANYKYTEISSLLKYMKSFPDLIFSRLTGSGSCIYSAFATKDSAEKALLIFKDRFPKHWSIVVENNTV